MSKRSPLAKAKFRSPYFLEAEALHLNLNSKPLCERLLQVFSEKPIEAVNHGSRTDNPSKIRCTFCLLAWDAINELGLKMKWPVSMSSNNGWVLIPLPHYQTVISHAERIINLLGGIETLRKSKDVWVYEVPPKAESLAEQQTRAERAEYSIDVAQGRE